MTATPLGSTPTGIGAPTTVSVVVSITETVSSPEFVIYAFWARTDAGANRQARDNAKASFFMPHPIVADPALGERQQPVIAPMSFGRPS